MSDKTKIILSAIFAVIVIGITAFGFDDQLCVGGLILLWTIYMFGPIEFKFS